MNKQSWFRIDGTNVIFGVTSKDYANARREIRKAYEKMERKPTISKYHELVRALISLADFQAEALGILGRQVEMIEGARPTQSGKRWTPDEDWLLIDLVTKDENVTLIDLALQFNRTPGAITSRLTYLVGQRKVSERIVAKLTGYLNGDAIESNIFVGTMERL